MSDQEQRDLVRRGLVTAGSAFAACTILPSISLQYDARRAEADFRAEAEALSLAARAADAVRQEAEASELLEHPWLRTVEYSLDREPRAALSRYAMRDRDGAAVSSLIQFEPAQLSRAEDIAAEHKCLSEAVYYEARSERTEGQLAVAEVIANRVTDHRYPNTICDVVYQGATRTTGCQFTFTCDGSMRSKPRGRKWDDAQTVAAHVMMDLHERRTGTATHYHATYVDPIWNAGLVRTARIDTHIFYRFPRGSEWAVAREAVERKRARLARQVAYIEESQTGGGEPADDLKVLSPAP
ncbi:MAG: cell wall hydrolase [Pseudomonadota bacterium]